MLHTLAVILLASFAMPGGPASKPAKAGKVPSVRESVGAANAAAAKPAVPHMVPPPKAAPTAGSGGKAPGKVLAKQQPLMPAPPKTAPPVKAGQQSLQRCSASRSHRHAAGAKRSQWQGAVRGATAVRTTERVSAVTAAAVSAAAVSSAGGALAFAPGRPRLLAAAAAHRRLIGAVAAAGPPTRSLR